MDRQAGSLRCWRWWREHRLVLGSGVPWGFDARLHLWAVAAITDALRNGGPSTLWLHPLAAGVPLLQFYPPIGFTPMVLAHRLGATLDVSFRWGLVFFGVVAAVGVQRALREWTGDRVAAVVGAAALAFSPYRLFDSHVRSALGETAAIAVLPFLWLALGRVLRTQRRGRTFLAITASTLALTHLLSAIVAIYGTIAWWLGHAVGMGRSGLRRSIAALPRLAVAGSLALALAAFFLLPLAVDLGATSVKRIVPAPGRFSAPGARPLDLLGAPPHAETIAAAPPSSRARILRRHYERLPVLPLAPPCWPESSWSAFTLASWGDRTLA